MLTMTQEELHKRVVDMLSDSRNPNLAGVKYYLVEGQKRGNAIAAARTASAMLQAAVVKNQTQENSGDEESVTITLCSENGTQLGYFTVKCALCERFSVEAPVK